MANRAVPSFATDFKLWMREAARGVNDLMKGRANNSGTFTLTANVGTSTMTDDRLGSTTAVVLIPATANAAAEIGNGTMYISEAARVNGSVVITHANNAQTDRTFRFLLMG